MAVSPLGNRFFSYWERSRQSPTDGGSRPPPGRESELLLRRTHGARRHHAAHIHFAVVSRDLEEAGVGLAFLNVGQQDGRVLRDGLNGEVQLLVDPDVRGLAVLIGDDPMVAGAAIDVFDTEFLAGDVGLAGAWILRVVGL